MDIASAYPPPMYFLAEKETLISGSFASRKKSKSRVFPVGSSCQLLTEAGITHTESFRNICPD
jgi:hypothetical protein